MSITYTPKCAKKLDKVVQSLIVAAQVYLLIYKKGIRVRSNRLS
jgi:hypothetical protein